MSEQTAQAVRAERAACRQAVANEALSDEPDNEEDRAYNLAITHALGAIDLRSRSHPGETADA